MKKLAVLFVLVVSLSTSCATVSPDVKPTLDCLAQVGEAAAKDAAAKIFATIDSGTASNFTEAQIIVSLESGAIAYAPDVWACAMKYVSRPDSAPATSTLKAMKPTVSSPGEASAIAADYLAIHKS